LKRVEGAKIKSQVGVGQNGDLVARVDRETWVLREFYNRKTIFGFQRPWLQQGA